MATIKKLVDEHSKVPGDIKIRHESWDFNEWFQPYYYAKSYWYGETYEYACYQFDDTGTGWQLYTEPKPKVKAATPGPWWQYLVPEERYVIDQDGLQIGHVNHARDAAYIEAANPATVLELVGELKFYRDTYPNEYKHFRIARGLTYD